MIEWQNGWFAFDRPDREGYYLGELRWEVGENAGQPLHAKEMRIVGWRRGHDNFIVYLPEDERFAYVLLIWRRDAVDRLPYCEFFEDETAVADSLDTGGCRTRRGPSVALARSGTCKQ